MSLVKQNCASTLGLVSGNGSIDSEDKDSSMLCHICVSALKQKKYRQDAVIFHNISRGFNYWKDDTIRSASHEVFSFYQEAIQVITKLAKLCGYIKEMLSKQHLENKKTNREYLL